MNQKELNEIRRHLSLKRCGIHKIYGCFVSSGKEIISDFQTSFGLMSEFEAEKYLSLLKKTLSGTLGKNLLDCLLYTSAQRIQDINPNCILHLIPEKYEAANRDQFFRLPYDYIVDAIDLVSCKLDLIETARSRSIPILSSMGTGNKLDPSQFRVADLSQTQGCQMCIRDRIWTPMTTASVTSTLNSRTRRTRMETPSSPQRRKPRPLWTPPLRRPTK